MKDASQDLQELKETLDALSPRDFAAWNEWIESRLTERLRKRQERRLLSVAPCSDGEENKDA